METLRHLKTLWKRASAISRAVGRPFREMSLQALENRSTETKMVLNLLEAGKSVTKLMPRQDQGRGRIRRGTSLPSGRQCGMEIMAQTEHPFTNRATSHAMLGHQYLPSRSERVCCLPGWQGPRDTCTESKRGTHKEAGS